MRLRTSLALTGPVLLALTGCTSDLPAPYNYDVLEPPPPDNELVVDCANLPVTAQGVQYDQALTITGLIDGVTYRYTATELPAGLTLDAGSGQLVGTVEAEPGTYAFDVTIADADDPVNYSAVGSCSLEVRPHLSAPVPLEAGTECQRPSVDLRSLVVAGTGDGTPIRCSYSGGNGNGRLPNGMTVDEASCTVTGTIDEDRYGTWVFAMRGTQSGADVYVPYCVTNDEAQGYEITASHGGNDDAALLPVVRTYDPSTSFSVGESGDPRFEVLAPGVCGGTCSYKYSFLRTNAPIGDGGFDLAPDGIIQNDDMTERLGFFHELRMSGPAMPKEFRNRPWILSVGVSYCIAPTADECDSPADDGDAAFEFGVIMVPTRG